MEEDTNDQNDMQREGMTKSGKSADQVKESVKETVAKGVAAVAGAFKGFSEEAKKHDLAGSAKQAVQKAGETTRELAGTAKKEFQETKDHLKGGGSSMGDPMGGTSSGASAAGSSYSGASSSGSPTAGVPDLRKTPLGTQSDLKDKTAPSSFVSGSTLDKKDDDDDASTMNDTH